MTESDSFRDRFRSWYYQALRRRGHAAMACLTLVYGSAEADCGLRGSERAKLATDWGPALLEAMQVNNHEARERAEMLCARVHALSVGLGRFSELSA